MILVDLNLILYATDKDSAHHQKAQVWWDENLSGTAPVGLCWTVLLGFIRISMHPRLPRPMSLHESLKRVDSWLEQPCVRILEPTENHWKVLKKLMYKTGTGADLATDAHLAALAIEHGCTLCSADDDFSKFPDLKWQNPLLRKH